MDKFKKHINTLIAGITIGIVITLFLVFSIKATPTGMTIAGVTFEFPKTPMPNPQICPYASDNDESTITKIIQAEAEAINKEDISIIRNIFDPSAKIRFQGDGTEWNDPVAHYLENFDNADVINAVHFNIQPTEQGITSNTAWFISGSSGTIIFADGERLDYYNELGKDIWVLKRNSLGCWVIVDFTFY